MAAMEVKSLESPDETRPFAAKGKADVVSIGGGAVMRATFEPGWRWSDHVKPIAGTDSCQAPHAGYVLSGRKLVRMDDGEEAEVGPGDAFVISPGHDAWTVADEACVLLDFSGMEHYAKQS